MTTVLRYIFLFFVVTAAFAQERAGGKRMHQETSFDVTVHAPLAQTVKLFTPEGERVWAGEHWNPQYLHEAGPERDGAGAVFTIQRGALQLVWTVLRRDDRAREYQYAYFISGVMITTIDVRFEPIGTQTTTAHVTYARTSVSPEGDGQVVAMSEADKHAGAEWQSAIEKYLAGQTIAVQ